MKFVLEIELDNDAMQTPDDVRSALISLCHEECTLANLIEFTDDDEGSIRDANGNTVGKWGVRQ